MLKLPLPMSKLYLQKRHQNKLLPAVLICFALVTCAASYATTRTEADTSHTVAGKVVDAHCIGISDVTVRVKGTHYNTVTNQYGNFRLNIPGELSDQYLKLQFTYIGYNRKDFRRSRMSDLLRTEVLMQADQQVSGKMELVVIVRRPSLWQRAKRLFAKNNETIE